MVTAAGIATVEYALICRTSVILLAGDAAPEGQAWESLAAWTCSEHLIFSIKCAGSALRLLSALCHNTLFCKTYFDHPAHIP